MMSKHREELKLLQQKLSRKDGGITGTEPASSSAQPSMRDADATNSVAIVGMHGYFPGSMSVREFWALLDTEQSAISEIPASRFDWRDYYDPSGKAAGKMRTRWGGFIPAIDAFDPLFFKIAPNDAYVLDPQQRLLLTSVWKTIEDAGHKASSLRRSRTGVYIGTEEQEYLQNLKDAGADLGDNILNHHPNMLANRISYLFDFHGPSEIVNTMCSSAAVALHRASAALRNGEIDNAIVGGTKIILRPDGFIAGSRLSMLSDTPEAKSFGKDANGYVRAEGVATVMLKRLADARRDRDHIYAAIRSSAINFNGAGGMSFVAPNPEAHAEVIRRCYASANIDPRDVEYIEAQGMGSQVSDIAEWEACNRAMQELCDQGSLSYAPGFCAISTLKPMIGHMESASAMGALFKIIHSLQTRKLYKILNLTDVNPYLETHGRPCRLLAQTEEWPGKGKPRLAGMHSYGSGGNNAHLLISEAINDAQTLLPKSNNSHARQPQLFVFSAKSQKILEKYGAEFVAFMASDEAADLRLEDIAFTLQVGRDDMSWRLAVIASCRDELLGRMRSFLNAPAVAKQQDWIFHGKATNKNANKTGLSSNPALSFEGPLSDSDWKTVASLWVAGEPIDWAKLNSGKELWRVSLPTYPFAQESYWIPVDLHAKSARQEAAATAAVGNEFTRDVPGIRTTSKAGNAAVLSPQINREAGARRVIVVGAGPSGLVTAKCLQDEGFEPIVLESSDRIGGIWAYRDNYASGPYKSTLTQLSKYTFFFSDFPPEESDPLFCDVTCVNGYLNRYIDHFQLRQRIKLNCSVQQVSPEGSGWKVTYYNAQEGIRSVIAVGVACCSGSFWQPAVPEFADKSAFSGLQITASAYHSNEIFCNKRVLVVGAGVSGADIVSDAAEIARKCTWSVREPRWFLPRMAGFVPNDCSVSFLKRFANLQMSRTDFVANLRRALPEYMARYEQTGLIPEASINNAILISDRVIDHVVEGRVHVRPGILGFDGTRAKFSDGHSEEFDVVVYCTGYHTPTYEWLRPIRAEDFQQNLFYRNNPSLFICNHPPGPPAFGAAPPYFELLARWYAGVLSGRYRAPESEDHPAPLESGTVDPTKFFDTWLEALRIAQEIGALPDPRKEWNSYWKFINMPPIPALFRLHGPQAWTGAEHWIQHVRRKCFLGSDSAETRDLKLGILAGLKSDELEHLRRSGQITDQEFAATQRFQGRRMTPWLTIIPDAERLIPPGAMAAIAPSRMTEHESLRRFVTP
jgi:3-oxoacyl-(acyl-carrier-protein) synthase